MAQPGSVLGHPPQMQGAYQEVTAQLGALAISQRSEVVEDETASADSYPSSPPTPDLQHQVVISGGSYVVVPSARSVIQGQMYQGHSMPVVPFQYVQGQGYQNPYAQSQYPQYVTAPERGSPYPQSQTPPMPQRSASPVMLGHPYLSSTPPSQPSIGRPSPVQTPTPPFTRTPPPSTVAPLIRTAMPPAPGGPMLIPVSGTSVGGSPAASTGNPLPQQMTSSSQAYWRSQQGKRGTKAPEPVHPDILRYQALAQEGQRIQGLHGFPGQQRPPLIQMIPVPQPYPYMPRHG